MIQAPALPVPATLAELAAVMRADPELSPARRRNLASSIKRLCEALGLDPAQTPAAFWALREPLARVPSAPLGITAHRWETIRSDVAFTLRRIGLAPDQPQPRAELSEAWTALLRA